MKFSFLKRLFYKKFVLSVVLFNGFNGYANDSVMVVNPRNSQNIYEVVFDSPKDETDEAPGVYSISRRGATSPIALGTVMGVSRGFNGVLAQSGMNDTSDSFSVINNKLTLYNKNSSPTARTKKPLVLGGNGFKVFDPFLGLELDLDFAITDLDNVAIKGSHYVNRGGGFDTAGQLFLISLKKPNQFGDGITIALMVEAPKSATSTPKITQSRAVVVSYDFIDELNLEGLLPSDGRNWDGNIFSPNLASSVLQKYKSQKKNPLISKWVKHIENYIKALRRRQSNVGEGSGEKAVFSNGGIPRYNILTEETSYSSLPALKLTNNTDDLSLYQIFDPRTDRWSVVDAGELDIRSASNDEASARSKASLSFVEVNSFTNAASLQMDGQVRFDDRGKYNVAVLNPDNKASGESEFLVSVGSNSVLLLRAQRSGQLKVLTAEGMDLSDHRSIDVLHMVKKYSGNEGTVHYIFFSVVSKTGKKRLYAMAVNETNQGELSVMYTENIANFNISKEELELRVRHINKGSQQGMYIDLDEVVKGAAHYRNRIATTKELKAFRDAEEASDVSAEVEEAINSKNTPYQNLRRTVRYRYLPNRKMNSDSRYAYLRAAKNSTAIDGGILNFIQFADKTVPGSDAKVTGFYADFIENHGSIDDTTLILEKPLFLDGSEREKGFFPGYPIYNRESASITPMALDATIYQSRKPVKLSVVPYSQKKNHKGRNEFDVLLTLSPSTTSSTSENLKTVVDVTRIPGGFESLVGAQIIKGVRNKSDEFHILFFFGKDPGGATGVYSVSGTVKVTYKNGADVAILDIKQSGEWLTKDDIKPSELKLRLKADPQGNYYWLDNPEEEKDSTKLRARELMSPSKFNYINREADGVERVQLRFDEEFDKGEGGNDLYGKWSVNLRYELKTLFPWFKKYIDSLEAKLKKHKDKKPLSGSYYGGGTTNTVGPDEWMRLHEASTVHFTQFLETIAGGRSTQIATQEDQSEVSSGPKHQIILVEESMKQVFLNDMMAQLWAGGKEFSLSADQKDFEFYAYDTTSTLGEGVIEMEAIANTGEKKRTVLFSTLSNINEASALVEEKARLTAEQEREQERARSEAEGNRDGDDDEQAREVTAENNLLSRWLFLATEGKKTNLRKLRKKITASDDNEVPILIIGTPKELAQAKAANPEAVQAGVFDTFEINNQFLTSSWMQWSPGSKNASTAITEYSRLPITEEEHRVFPDIEKLFSQAADGELEGEQLVLIVSDELKPLINKLIMTRWATSSQSLSGGWHHTNQDLLLYNLEGDRTVNTQDMVFENFQAMRGSSDHKSVVFYGDLERVAQIGRPFNNEEGDKPFKLKDPISRGETANILALESSAAEREQPDEIRAQLENARIQYRATEAQIEKLTGQISAKEEHQRPALMEEHITPLEIKLGDFADQIADLTVGSEATKNKSLPHLMWLIAAEGEKVQPKAGKNWSLSSAVDRKLTTIMVGTPEEWETIEKDMGFEANYLDPKEHFKIVELDAPSEDVKADLVRSLFQRPEIQSLDYQFIIDGLNSEDAERQLVSHFVNRIEQIAMQQNIESTTAFIKAFAELRQTLVEDTALRRSRRIDKNFLERLFFKIFPLPISLENLEGEDPLNRLQNIPEAARRLQQLGYHGAMDLKERTLETILSQTRGSDGGRPIPNSQIYFGGTSSGKTFLFKKKVELLGLQKYDPNKASNEDADYIIISVQNLIDGGNEESGKMTVDRAIEMVQDLIAQPKGHRAFILFDDAHKTSGSEVHQKLFSFIQSLFEAPEGLIRVKRKGAKEYKEVPVQNLNLYMTVNPTANKEQKEKYAEGTDLNRLVLAALANHGVDMEESVLARWSDIIDLDKFPRGAKVPALVERVRKSSASTGTTVLVAPSAIDVLVEKFPDANAREFLNPAAAALTRIPTTAEKSSLYLVTPRSVQPTDADFPARREGSYLNSTYISSAVSKLTQTDAITINEPKSILRLIDFLMGNFRTQVFNHMVLATQNTDGLRLDAPGQNSVLQKHFILASMTHLLKHPRLPLSEMRLQGQDFSFLSEVELSELVDLQIALKSERSEEFFPFQISSGSGLGSFDALGFIQNTPLTQSMQRTRQDVFKETVDQIEVVFKKMLRLYARLQKGDLNQALSWTSEDIKSWYEDLPEKDMLEEYKKLSQEMVSIYRKFTQDFYDPNLNYVGELSSADFTLYDQGRIFGFLIDKALTKLPWGVMSKFVLDVMNESVDLALGQKPHFINYAYAHEISPLAVATTDFLNETFADDVKDGEMMNRLNSSFKLRCEASLTEAVEVKE